MDKKQKNQMKDRISQFIDLANGRYKDDELNCLFNLVENIDEYANTKKTYHRRFSDYSSDGKYTRTEETTYTLLNTNNRISVEKIYSYEDDDGQTGGMFDEYTTGREILRVLEKVIKK